MDQGPQLDIVSVVTSIMTLLWSPALAGVIAPYSVIVIAASTGAAWSLGRHGPQSRMSAAFFFARINGMAILLTVLICNLLETYVFHTPIKWALVPVALGIGWIGDGWPAIFSVVFDWVKSKLSGIFKKEQA